MDWYLYILDCDGRYYTGITKDPERRLAEHRAGKSRGARFTRAANSHELVYSTAIGSRSLALRAESRVKKLPRPEKAGIVLNAPPRDALLARLGLDPASASVDNAP